MNPIWLLYYFQIGASTTNQFPSLFVGFLLMFFWHKNGHEPRSQSSWWRCISGETLVTDHQHHNAIDFQGRVVWLASFREGSPFMMVFTLPETKIAPKKWWFPIGISFSRGLFSGSMLVSGRVYVWVYGQWTCGICVLSYVGWNKCWKIYPFCRGVFIKCIYIYLYMIYSRGSVCHSCLHFGWFVWQMIDVNRVCKYPVL